MLGVVKAVAQVQIGPAVSGCNGLIHFFLQRPQPHDVLRILGLVMEAVVGLRQSLLPLSQDLASKRIKVVTTPPQSSLIKSWEGKRFKTSFRCVPGISLQR